MLTKQPLTIKVDKWTFTVPTDRVYNENDCWAKLEGTTATVGITDFLQNMASDIIFVELPEIGLEIEQFEEVGSFEAIKIMLDVISPVSGIVEEVNTQLLETPERINQDPYQQGWFVRIRVSDFETDKAMLLDPKQYFTVMKRKIESERKKLNPTSQRV